MKNLSQILHIKEQDSVCCFALYLEWVTAT